MQYWRLVGMPGIRPVSRFQIAFAILMYFGSPIWLTFIVIATYSLTADQPVIAMRADLGSALFLLLLVMSFAPKIATMLDVLLSPSLRRAFGGGWRFLANTLTEFVFTTLLVPITSVVHTVFLARLLMGQSITWGTQARDGHDVPFSYALQRFWLQTVVGVVVIGAVWLKNPQYLPYALFAALGLAISIPFAVTSASVGLGRLCTRLGIWQLPEEKQPPAMLVALKISAIETPASPMAANAG
jgi:membrane glycosyltransferase